MTSATLPSSWFRQPEIYDLERRAIFSKTWLIVSHKSQFATAGQYALYEVAGYPFFVIRDREGSINAFLNVCRHRAFPIVHEETGKASILSCKYHGWSYGLKGNLAKAPRFDTVPKSEFNKDEFSLYKLHLHIDQLGFVWVNLDASEKPSLSWEEQFKEIDTQERITEAYNMDDYVFDHTWSLDDCNFNWKTLVENYNECYHCSTAHPGIAPFITKETRFDVEPKLCYIRHLAEDIEAGDINASPTFMFPNSSVTMSKHFFYMMFIVPTSATTSRMRYEVYRNKNSSEEEFTKEIDFFKQVENEDKYLGTNAQKGLNSDTYNAGPLHPYMEHAVKYFESLVRSTLKSHVEEEKSLGKEIWPARRKLSNAQLDEDEAFCRGVCESAKATSGNGALAW
ncbi:Rieske iron-sulfur domain-containing protein [Penicillium concentricum]|uniref:Choline monooxygenase, chloroplastic n=1 Tax=Penicillium concentricum TaxID=293559 RepID=A0A9W9VKF0_9EURO|nr:Rieske iron-sulfur domain-containing protein [Penicillium concentricum]KAJ5382631.1 Rieske iron-sulfur domain-containing protein [Penicillium concentricum]